jgi:hypothetical protein
MEVRRHGEALAVAPDEAEVAAASIRQLICVVQVQPDELAGDSLSPLACDSQLLRPLGNPGLINHDRTSSLAHRCESSRTGLGR